MKKTEVVLEIEDSIIRRVKWKGGHIDVAIPAYGEEPLGTIATAIGIAQEQVEPEWDKEEFIEFIKGFTEKQIAIITVLLKEKRRISNEILAKKVGELLGEELTPHDLAGSLGGITRRTESENKEYFLYDDWEKNEKVWYIDTKYVPLLMEALRAVNEKNQ